MPLRRNKAPSSPDLVQASESPRVSRRLFHISPATMAGVL
jgi:hypothetical protein